jgi:DNA-binding NtrC family response regulator
VDLVLADYKTPDMNRIALLEASKQLNLRSRIALITAYGSIASAVIELLWTVGCPAVYTQILTLQ